MAAKPITGGVNPKDQKPETFLEIFTDTQGRVGLRNATTPQKTDEISTKRRPLTGQPLPHKQAIDTNHKQSHTEKMNDITRDELRGSLSGIEERMDKRIDRMEQSEDRRADAYRREQEARDRLYAERFEATNRRVEDRDIVIDSKLDAMNASIMSAVSKIGEFESKLSTNIEDVKASNRSTAQFIIGTVIASVLAMLAINATIIYGAKSFFDSGKEVAALQTSIEDLKKSNNPPKLEPSPGILPAPAAIK